MKTTCRRRQHRFVCKIRFFQSTPSTNASKTGAPTTAIAEHKYREPRQYNKVILHIKRYHPTNTDLLDSIVCFLVVLAVSKRRKRASYSKQCSSSAFLLIALQPYALEGIQTHVVEGEYTKLYSTKRRKRL